MKDGRGIDKHLTIKKGKKKKKRIDSRKNFGKKYKNLYKNTLSSQLFFITSNAQSIITMPKKKTRNQEKAGENTTEATSPYPNTIYKSSTSLILVDTL